MNYIIQVQMPVGDQVTMHYLSKSGKLVRNCTPYHPSEHPKLFKLRHNANKDVKKIKEQLLLKPKVHITVVPVEGVCLQDH